MKKLHIVGLFAIVVGIVLLSYSSKDMTTYADFTYAEESGKYVSVVGTLSKDKPITYNPEENPNLTEFFMRDKDSLERKVILHMAKPQDFELSEQVVIKGSASDGEFVAKDILLKCPSKYKDEEIALKNMD